MLGIYSALILSGSGDIEAYSKAGGDQGLTEKATAQIAAAELATTTSTLEAKLGGTPVLPIVVLPTVDDVSSTHRKFAFREVEGRGLGAFATREFHRGDLILADQPLFTNNDRKPVNVISAVQKLSPNEKKEFFSLKNAHSGSQGPICGIFNTNAFSISDTASAICMLASRFNHSCSPNARYSWHAAGGRLRIYALRKIAVGEEVFVSYISGRRVYGSRRKDRQDRLKTYGFICSCVVCSLPLSEQKASDRRRAEIARIWESVPYYMPHQTADRLRAIVHAVHLLEEEGYAADKDDFTNDAATICASHADWESVEYWATKTYETRVAEFGEDSQRAADVRNIYLDLKRSPNAATQRKQKFSVRL
jgi:hypothetical protein